MGRIYQIHLFDAANATKLDILARATAIRFTREVRGTDEIRFDLHRDDPQLDALRMGRYVRVFDRRAETYRAAGFLAGGLDYGVDPERPFVHVRAFGGLTRLSFLRFPPGYRLRGSLDANRDRLVQRYDWRRLTAKDTTATGALGDEVLSFDGGGTGNQLGEFTNTESVETSPAGDLYEDGGAVVLTRTGDDYDASGTYVTPFVDFGTTPTAFDRLRVAYVGEIGRIAYRVNSYASLGDARTFTGTPVSDAEARSLGVDLAGLTPARYVAVEFTLTTNRPDESPRLEAVDVIARRAVPGITAATFPSVELGTLDVGGLSLRRALDLICERFGLEYRLTPGGTLEMQSEPDAGTVGAVWGTDRRDVDTFAEGKNANVLRFEQEDTALTNEVFAYGNGEEATRLVCVVRDAGSQDAYGVRQAFVRFNSRTLADLKSNADAYLAAHQSPAIAATIEVLETPSGTADFEPGDLVRIVSRFRKDHAGNDLDETVRIVRECREERESGERIVLYGESKPRSVVRDILASASSGMEASLRHVAGAEWTPVISDSLERTFTVALPFTPASVCAEVIEVEEDPSGSPAFYTAHGGSVELRVMSADVGSGRMTYALKRVRGTLDCRARVRWEAWGRAEELARLDPK